MKKTIFLILFSTIILNLNAQADSVRGNVYKLKGKIIHEVCYTPHCGYFAFASVFEFKIIDFSDSTYSDKNIPVIFTCPELYHAGFFEIGAIYDLELSDQNQAGFDYIIPNVETLNKYRLKTRLWVVKAKKNNK